MKTRSQNYRAAFSLVELMIAIGIFGMIMVAIFSTWTAILRGSRVGMAAAAEVQRTRIAVRALEESLSATVMFVDNAKYYGFFSDTSGKNVALSFVARLPMSFPGSGMFRDQDLRRVTFFVEGGQLMLSQSPVLEATEKIGKPYTIALAPGVTLFDMEFYDGLANKWFAEWVSTNQLPKMVRVALSFSPEGAATDRTRMTLRSIPLAGVQITRAGAGVAGGSGLRNMPPGLGARGRPPADPAGAGQIPGGPGGAADHLGFDPYSVYLPPNFNLPRAGGFGRERNSLFPTYPY